MADPLTDFLDRKDETQAPAPGPSSIAPKGDPLLDFLNGGGSSQQAPRSVEDFLDSDFKQKGYVDLFTSGVARNYAQFQAIAPSMQAMWNESQGDMIGAVEKAKKAQEILKGAGDSQYELFSNVHSMQDFSYWLTEKLGEQAITTAATMATGGGGALTTNLMLKGLVERGVVSKATAETAMLAGASVPTYALSSAMEGASTSQEQFEVTGSPQAGLSAAAGLSKGLLELWAPMSIARHLISPQTVVGQSFKTSLLKTALKEGSTEYAQELIDIAARQYNDPNYSFFGTGATPWYQGEGFLRAAESGATGFAVGAVYGAPFARAEARAAREKALGNQKPGTRESFNPTSDQSADIINQNREAPEELRPNLPPGIHMVETPVYGGRALNITLHNGAPTDENQIGRLYFRGTPQGGFQAANLHIDDEYQRQGIMTEVQNYVEQKYGVQMEPDFTMSDAEMARWRKKASENNDSGLMRKLQGYKHEGGMWYQQTGLFGGAFKNLSPEEQRIMEENRKNRGAEAPLGGPMSADYVEQKYGDEIRKRLNAGQQISAVAQALDLPLGTVTRISQERAGLKRTLKRGAEVLPPATEGPVTNLRRKVIPPGAESPIIGQYAFPKTPRDDVGGFGPLTADVRNQDKMREAILDHIDHTTPRYIEQLPDGRLGNRILTDTEIELYEALYRQQNVPSKWLLIDHGSLQPVGISAHVTDLADPRSGKVWFINPKLTAQQKQQMLMQYEEAFLTADALYHRFLTDLASRNALEQNIGEKYGALLTQGLRVVPSRGAGFYYNLGVKTLGEAQDPAKLTKRSIENAWYDPGLGRLTPFRGDERQVQGGSTQLLVSYDANKVNPDDFTKMANGDLIMKKVDLQKLVPGIRYVKDRQDMNDQITVPNTRGFAPKAFVSDVKPENAQVAKAIETIGNKLMPQIQKVLNSIGYTEPIPILISDNPNIRGNGTSPAFALTDQGMVLIVPENLGMPVKNIGFNEHVANLIAHEIGHLVTMRVWTRLPVAVQMGLTHAWEKALLAGRMKEFSKTGMSLRENPGPANSIYWTSMPEWFAEQFRRWITSDREALTHLEVAIKGLAQKMESFIRSWETQVPEAKIQNLLNPDHFFSAFMEYLRGVGDMKKINSQLQMRAALLQQPADVPRGAVADRIATTVANVLESFQHMIPAGVSVVQTPGRELNPNVAPEVHGAPKGSIARWVYHPTKRISLIEIAMGAMYEDSAFEETRLLVPHELMHAYEDLQIITDQDIAILMKDIKGKEDKLFPAKDRANLLAMIKEVARKDGRDEAWVKATYQTAYEKELRAYYIQEFADTGVAYSQEGRDVISWILNLIDQIRNAIQGLGMRSRDDVVRAFYSGEMLERGQNRGDERITYQKAKLAYTIDQARRNEMVPSQVIEVEPGIWMASEYFGPSKTDADAVSYMFFEKKGMAPTGANPPLKRLGALIGHVILEKDWRKGYQVSDLASDRPGFAARIAIHVLRDLGLSQEDLIPPASATKDGKVIYAWAARNTKWKGVFDYYVMDHRSQEWMSPNHIKQMLGFWSNEIQKNKIGQSEYKLDTISREYHRYAVMYDKVPQQAWNDPRLEQMFSLRRNVLRDGIRGSMIREGEKAQGNQLQETLGMPAEGQTQDAWMRSAHESSFLSQNQRAAESGMSFDMAAPESMLSYGSRRMWERLTGYGNNPRLDPELKNLAHEQDRIGKFTKIWWTLDQLLWRNPKLVGLQEYREYIERMKQLGASWLNRADETARAWHDVTDPVRREGVTSALFNLTEMNYLLPAERTAKIVRLPSNWGQFLTGIDPPVGGELDRLFKRARLDPKDYNLIRRVAKDFADFLTDVEAIREKILLRAHGPTSSAYVAARAALQKEMDELRAKPYFPMMRFGEFTVALRDPSNNKIVYANAYMTQAQRDAAALQLRVQYPGTDLTVGRIDPRMQEFMSLPGPLIREIRTKMPVEIGLSKADQDKMTAWLEEFEHHNAPDRSFRKRWMPSKGIPGYSMDAFRAYSHYFMYGSRYLARLAYMDELQTSINKVNATVTSQLGPGNTAKRQAIVKYMQDHYQYMMESGRDGGKFRAFVSLFMLGFSPAAAIINLTQPFMVLWPKLTADFGLVQANGVFNQGFNALKATMGYATGDPRFEAARAEMVRQGYIEVGQAAELGAFAEGNNLSKLLAGTDHQKFWRALSYWGMFMFSKAEHFNRELTFKTAYQLALQNMGSRNAALSQIETNHPLERTDLMRRAGLTYQEAIAFLYAKDAIKRTQFEFSKDTDPPIMRHPIAKNFLIFFKYTHSMLYAMRFNGATTQMLLLMAFMYGLQGLPGSDEWNEMLKLLAKKIFGVDFDLQEKARGFARDLTKGTVFDQTGPDLLMHGISRYGFGLGLLPEGWGAPRFDASANGSMGRIVPGLAEFLHGVNTGQRFNDMIAQSAQRAAGAGYGQVMTLMNLMLSPSTVDQHRYEQLLPRFMKGWAAAYRYGVDPQAETTRQGAKVAKFNPTDPDDLATIAAQVLGFHPTKVNERWELMRASHEVVQTYNARKADIYVQYNKAMMEKNPAAMHDVLQAVNNYNEQVMKEFPMLAIKPDELRNSIRQRSTARQLTEQFLAASKRDILVTQKLMDQYPGVRLENVK